MNEHSAVGANSSASTLAYEVPELSFIRVDGQDAVKVLNGLCTANLNALSVGDVAETFFTDDRGRVMAHVRVARDTNGAWLVGQLPEPEKLVAHIDRFIFREDATPRDVTKAWNHYLLDGAALSERLASACYGTNESVESAGIVSLTSAGHQLLCVRLPITSAHARVCLVPVADRAWFDEFVIGLGSSRANESDFETRRIQNFWPRAGCEITQRTLPQELDRDDRAISFTKGCYLGQETVARLDAMGQVQRKLCLIRLSGQANVPVDAPLFSSGKEVGKLTSVAPHTENDYRYALAYMRRGSFAAGSSFEVNSHSGQVVAHG